MTDRNLTMLVDFYEITMANGFFENGRGDLAYRLLTSDGRWSFDQIRRAGATTLWEYWTGRRSHSHPMFGAVVASLFRYLLGIRLPEEGVPFYIAPVYPGRDAFFSGGAVLTVGYVSVDVCYEGRDARFTVETPCDAALRFDGKDFPLQRGRNVITVVRQG